MGSKAMKTNRQSRTGRRAAVIAATIAGAVAAGLLMTACASSSTPSTSSTPTTGSTGAPAGASAGTAALKTEKTSIGTVLADSAGMTVYWFAADHGTTSACNGACAAIWPPVIGTPQAAAGVSLTGSLGTITRSNGQKQATYDGHPLYTFKQDTAPGQVHGNKVTGFGAEWYAITIGASSGATTAPSSSSGYGGGGY